MLECSKRPLFCNEPLRKRAACPIEQANLEAGFQGANLAGYGRCGHTQLPRRTREAPLLDGKHEQPDSGHYLHAPLLADGLNTRLG